MTRIHLLDAPTDAERPRLVAALPSAVELTIGGPPTRPVDVLVGGRPQPEDLACVQQALVVPFSGIPPETRQRLLEHRPSLAVYNLHHNAEAVAEHTVALLLSAARLLVPMDRALRSFDWRPRYAPDPGTGLARKTALIVGWGAIGQRVAPVLRALGMRVRGIRRRVRPTDPPSVSSADTLDTELAGADVIVVCLPHTTATDGLFNARRLRLCRRGAILVNVGRGAIVDDRALYDALRDGQLHSAALDTWWTYPCTASERTTQAPATAPLWTLDTVVMSPHRAGHGPHVEAARTDHLVTTLLALHHTGSAPHRVDVTAGY